MDRVWLQFSLQTAFDNNVTDVAGFTNPKTSFAERKLLVWDKRATQSTTTPTTTLLYCEQHCSHEVCTLDPREDRLFNATLLAVIAMYFILAQATTLTGGRGLPNFDVSSPGSRPADVSKFSVEFLSLNGDTLEQRVALNDFLAEQEVENVSAVEELVNQLGIAFFKEDMEEADRLRAEFEEVAFVGVSSAEYNLIFLKLNPVERYNWGTNVAKEYLTTFKYRQPIVASAAP